MTLAQRPLAITFALDVAFSCTKVLVTEEPSLSKLLTTIFNFPIWVALVIGSFCVVFEIISNHKYIKYLNTRHHIVRTINERGGVVPVEPTRLRTHFSPRIGDRDITSATPTSANRRWGDGVV